MTFLTASSGLIQTQSPELGDGISYHISLPEVCLNWMSNCCNSKAQWSSTGLDIPVVKKGTSGLWLQYNVHFVSAR